MRFLRYKGLIGSERRETFDMDWRKRLLDTSKSKASQPGVLRIGNRTIRFQLHYVWLLATAAFLLILFFYVKPSTASKNLIENDTYQSSQTAAISTSYNPAYPLSSAIISNGIINFKIAVVADMDTNSRMGKDDQWKSFLKRGFLSYNSRQQSVAVNWDEEDNTELVSNYALKGRGMELSELVVFNGRLLTVDDRTGIIYEISKDKMIPWVILTDGDGNSSKGFKSEWATVKEQHLFVGSSGKEWTSATGEYLNDDPMWVKKISTTGQVEHINWTKHYKAMREVMGIKFPGYLIHESGAWSDEHQKWFFLPRRCSSEKYDDMADEKRGCNVLVSADANFSRISTTKIGNLVPTLGYSTFKFVPNTQDSVIVALKSEEVDGKTATYITVFKTDGQILLPDQKISSTLKYEGLEFV